MRIVLAALLGLLLALPARTAEWVDLELVLLADASRSIDDGEIRFQRQNYADAITHPDVLGAIANGYRGRIAVTYVEWGDENWQSVVVPWTLIDGKAAAEAFVAALLAAPRRAQGPNAIGSAIAAGHLLLRQAEIEGERQVIDFSGDSAYSFGGVPVPVARAAALADGITINGLAILCRECESGRPVDYDLEGAFRDFIIGGPGAFVVTADDRRSFAEAVRRKLLLEIAGDVPPVVLAAAGGDYGTRDEALTMLERVVAAIRADKRRALAAIARGSNDFVDRDLYAFCAGPDGQLSAHPYVPGGPFRDFVDLAGKPVGREVFARAKPGEVGEIDYRFVRPGSSNEALDKVLLFTKVDDQICGVGYYFAAPTKSTAAGTVGSTG